MPSHKPPSRPAGSGPRAVQAKPAGAARVFAPPPLAPFHGTGGAVQAKRGVAQPPRRFAPPPLAPLHGAIQAKPVPPPHGPAANAPASKRHQPPVVQRSTLDKWLLSGGNTQEQINKIVRPSPKLSESLDDEYEFEWNIDETELTVTHKENGDKAGEMELDVDEGTEKVWLDHIEVYGSHKNKGLGTRMILYGVRAHGKDLRLPGLGISGVHAYYWYDDEGRRLGASCLRRGIISNIQLYDSDVPLK